MELATWDWVLQPLWGTRNMALGFTKPGVVNETYLQARLFRVTFLVKRWARILKKLSTLCSDRSRNSSSATARALGICKISRRSLKGLGFKFTLPCFPCVRRL